VLNLTPFVSLSKYSFIIEQGCDEIYSLITNLWETAKLTQQLEEEAKQQSAGQETEKKRRTSAKVHTYIPKDHFQTHLDFSSILHGYLLL
jgi:hypothetical protein